MLEIYYMECEDHYRALHSNYRISSNKTIYDWKLWELLDIDYEEYKKIIKLHNGTILKSRIHIFLNKNDVENVIRELEPHLIMINLKGV